MTHIYDVLVFFSFDVELSLSYANVQSASLLWLEMHVLFLILMMFVSVYLQ